MRIVFAAAAALAMLSTPVFAAPCKDAKGKFTKCRPKAPAKPVRCKAANGRFAKCGTPRVPSPFKAVTSVGGRTHLYLTEFFDANLRSGGEHGK
jgi:hypothetical protein